MLSIWKRKTTKKSELKPMGWEPQQNVKCGLSIVQWSLLLLIALCLMMLSACSKPVSITPMPAPPANLASDCPQLQDPPYPLIDPARSIWEIGLLTAYADCAARHRMAIDAWKNAIDQD